MVADMPAKAASIIRGSLDTRLDRKPERNTIAHMKEEPILAAVINWNGWRDTLDCVQSMLGMAGPRFHLLICDNASTDESYECLCAWARALGPAREWSEELGAQG